MSQWSCSIFLVLSDYLESSALAKQTLARTGRQWQLHQSYLYLIILPNMFLLFKYIYTCNNHILWLSNLLCTYMLYYIHFQDIGETGTHEPCQSHCHGTVTVTFITTVTITVLCTLLSMHMVTVTSLYLARCHALSAHSPRIVEERKTKMYSS